MWERLRKRRGTSAVLRQVEVVTIAHMAELIAAAEQDFRGKWDFGLYAAMSLEEAVEVFAIGYFDRVIPASPPLNSLPARQIWRGIMLGVERSGVLTKGEFHSVSARLRGRYLDFSQRPASVLRS